MYEKKILDHGYLKVIETWGSDEMIVETARMSTGKGFLGWGPNNWCSNCGDAFEAPERDCPNPAEGVPYVDCGRGGHLFKEVPGDEKFLRFLYENHHATPFEFAGMTIEVQAPIMVFREWHRHRTQSYSERSARYAPLPAFDYMPTPYRVMMVNAKDGNRQAGALKGSDELTFKSTLEGLAELADLYEHSERCYQSLLKRGFPKELARLANTVGRYSTMRASTDLRNWLGFSTLRVAPTAQNEIWQFATAATEALTEHFPRTLAVFEDLRRGP